VRSHTCNNNNPTHALGSQDAKRKATGLEETAAQTDESEQAWDAKVAESIEAAAADARVAVACDPQNVSVLCFLLHLVG